MPTAAEGDTAWQAEAHCAHLARDGVLDLNDFFYEGLAGSLLAERVAELKFICSNCSVLLECRDFVDFHRDGDGFWAGETRQERKDRWAGVVAPVAIDEPTTRPDQPQRRTEGIAKL